MAVITNLSTQYIQMFSNKQVKDKLQYQKKSDRRKKLTINIVINVDHEIDKQVLTNIENYLKNIPLYDYELVPVRKTN